MARPFDPPLFTPLIPSVPQKLELSLEHSFQNRYTTLDEYPMLLAPMPIPSEKLVNLKTTNLKTTKPFEQGYSSISSVQTKESYAMKTPETFARAVNPSLVGSTVVPTVTQP